MSCKSHACEHYREGVEVEAGWAGWYHHRLRPRRTPALQGPRLASGPVPVAPRASMRSEDNSHHRHLCPFSWVPAPSLHPQLTLTLRSPRLRDAILPPIPPPTPAPAPLSSPPRSIRSTTRHPTPSTTNERCVLCTVRIVCRASSHELPRAGTDTNTCQRDDRNAERRREGESAIGRDLLSFDSEWLIRRRRVEGGAEASADGGDRFVDFDSELESSSASQGQSSQGREPPRARATSRAGAWVAPQLQLLAIYYLRICIIIRTAHARGGISVPCFADDRDWIWSAIGESVVDPARPPPPPPPKGHELPMPKTISHPTDAGTRRKWSASEPRDISSARSSDAPVPPNPRDLLSVRIVSHRTSIGRDLRAFLVPRERYRPSREVAMKSCGPGDDMRRYACVDKSPPSLIPAPLYSSSSLSRKTSSNISQLRTGFTFLNADRAKSGFINSASCDACGDPFETRAHFLLECQSWEPVHQPLYAASRSVGLCGPLHVAPLLSHPKLLKALGKFVETTARFE
ncbi:hypothetical protein B0H11DRAFT_2341763 [Mycena galericulata]|nr:hypothetical protein B0H11DRAFT_2341763 [Mycena galericulata]